MISFPASSSAHSGATPVAPQDRPQLRRGLVVDRPQQAPGWCILLHPTEARWALANEESLFFLDFFDGARTVREIVRALMETWPDVPPEVLAEDLEAFLEELRRTNLLASHPIPTPAAPPPATPSMTVYLTEECNLRCKHCAIVDGKMPDPKLTDERIRQLIDEHTARHDNPTVSFLGGEPLLRDSCLELLHYARQRTSKVMIGTNGLLVDDALAARLAELDIGVQVSLDGATAETHDSLRGRGQFDKTWAALGRLVAAGMKERLSVAMVLTRCGLGEVQEMVARCDELGIGTVRFLPLNKTGAAVRYWPLIAPDPEELRCITRWLIFEAPARDGACTDVKGSFPGYVPDQPPTSDHWCPIGKALIVDSQGLVMTCPAMTVPEVQLGNVLEKSLGELADGPQAARVRADMMQRRDRVEECRVCEWRNFCRGGCTASLYHGSGSLLANDGNCGFRRDLYRENVLRKGGLGKVVE